MKTDTPCPACDRIPIDILVVADGEIRLCPACGYQGLTAGRDIEAQFDALSDYDADLTANWRDTLGL